MIDDITMDEINEHLSENALTLTKDVKKLSLIESPFTNKQLLVLLQKTPNRHIQKRPAKGGGQWDYVSGVYMKKVLNYAFGWMWDFEIKDKGVEGDCIWVQGKLTIKNQEGQPMIIKEQFGRADIKMKKTGGYLDYGNDLKAASTDALKKCAAELGIASDIYGKDEFQEVDPVLKQEIKNGDDPASANQIEMIQNLMKNKKIVGAAVTMFLKKYEIIGLDKLTKGLAITIIKDLVEGK